jgi:hypothetical protein
VGHSQGNVRSLQFAARDLDFKVEDPGGKVRNLTLKETPTEIRIDLTADVLFAFDRATLLLKAQGGVDAGRNSDSRQGEGHSAH